MRVFRFLLVCSSLLFCSVGQAKASADELDDANAVVGRPGFYVAGNLGVFGAIGGYKTVTSDGQRVPRDVSAIKPYVGINVGYDILKWVGVGVRLGNGFVSGAARSQTDPESPTDYNLLMIDGTVTGAAPLVDRLKLELALFGGFTYMMPALSPSLSPYGANGGLSLGLRFDTLLTDMVVGIDLSGYVTYLPSAPAGASNIIWAFSVAPIVKYVF